jgi:methionine synthase II (cobalamin-independent)
MATFPLLPVTVIGSWSFPGWYAKFCDDAARHPDQFGDDDREEALSDAVRLAVDDQLRAGAVIITDGEMQLVAERLRLTLQFIDPERVPVTPDCGISQTAGFIARGKLANLAAEVRLVRTALGKP